MITEWWSLERDTHCGRWIEVSGERIELLDELEAELMADDDTVVCIHRTTIRPTTERPGKSDFSRTRKIPR